MLILMRTFRLEVTCGWFSRRIVSIAMVKRASSRPIWIYVWIEPKDMPTFQVQHNMFARISIETGMANDRSVEIISGLSPGELIAVSGALALQSGHAALK